MNKLHTVGATLAVVLAMGLGVSAPAWAEDPPVDPAPAVESTPEVVVEQTPVVVIEEEPVVIPDPVVEEEQNTEDQTGEVVPTEVTTFSRVQSNVKLPICHSGNGNHWSYIAPDANGYNGHKNHDADIYGLSEAECLAKNVVVVDEPVDVDYTTVAWLAPAAPPHHFDSDQHYLFHEDTEDPSLSTLDDEIAAYLATLECGTTADIQVDVYIDNATTDSLIAGGVLHGPSDPDEDLIPGGEGTAWKFVHLETEDCPTPPVECQVTSQFFTELDDQAPIQGQYGLIFNGGSGDAVGIGYGVSGNLQGLPTINYSASGDLDLFYPRIVINSLADGGYGYDSLTVISEGPVTGDSIAASNKRGFEQHTLTEWAALLPNNQLLAIFFHLDSGAAAGKQVVLSSISSEGCGSAGWVPEQPEDYSTYTEWEDGEYGCEVLDDEVPSVEVTRIRTDHTFTWDSESASYTESTTDTQETDSRALTEDEVAALHEECDEETPTPTPTPTTPPASGGLANTGLDPSGLLWAAAILVSAGAAVGGARLIAKRRTASQR